MIEMFKELINQDIKSNNALSICFHYNKLKQAKIFFDEYFISDIEDKNSEVDLKSQKYIEFDLYYEKLNEKINFIEQLLKNTYIDIG